MFVVCCLAAWVCLCGFVVIALLMILVCRCGLLLISCFVLFWVDSLDLLMDILRDGFNLLVFLSVCRVDSFVILVRVRFGYGCLLCLMFVAFGFCRVLFTDSLFGLLFEGLLDLVVVARYSVACYLLIFGYYLVLFCLLFNDLYGLLVILQLLLVIWF